MSQGGRHIINHSLAALWPQSHPEEAYMPGVMLRRIRLLLSILLFVLICEISQAMSEKGGRHNSG